MRSRLPFPAPWTWRPLVERNVPALASLALSVQWADGGLPLSADSDLLKDRYLPEPPGKNVGCFSAEGVLVAAAAVQANPTAQEYRCQFIGLVHPDSRGQGLGRFLFEWGMEQGQEILDEFPADKPHSFIGLIEGVTTAADHLYSRYGFTQQFAEDVMRIDLKEAALTKVNIPVGIALKTWSSLTIPQFYQAYQEAFRDRPGFPRWSQAHWAEWTADDDDFLAKASLLALRGPAPVGFITCSKEWINQVGVVPAERGRGLGSALVLAALQQLRNAGNRQAWLDVNVNNPEAAHLYQKLGFQPAGRRARYHRQGSAK